MDKLTLSVKETAKILGVGKDSIYELIHQDKIPFLQIGKRKLIPRKEFDKWFQKLVNNKAI